MKKLTSIIFILIISILLFRPVNSYALSIENYAGNNIEYRLEGETEEDCNGLLGNPDDEDSVAWLIQTVLNYTRILGPILILVLSSIDFAKVILNSDDDSMAKAKKSFGRRLILAGLLFFVPTIVNILLGLFGIYSDPTCGLH